ncbi:interleukin-1 beta [Elgaria multicarinata webbii]|uniref:interleukin-1 beta n=1 Tax=Elgaria multicarinata webbii TaxID=159646 RepID=UPI002FCD52CA
MNEMQFYEADRPGLNKNAFPALSHQAHHPHVCDMDIQVKITKDTLVQGFRKAVVIVLAIEKMKKSPKALQLFTDEDLMDIFNTVLEPVDFDTSEFTYAPDSIYQFSEDICCDIEDIDHKSLVLHEPAQLVAVHLQGPNTSHAVRLKMSVYRPKMEAGTRKTPVALNIKGRKLYLSCVWNGGQPVLQLEETNIQGDLDQSTLGRFLFYRVVIGKHTRFESAAFPHWYICTSSESDEVVGMTNRLGEVFIVDYKVTSQS